MYALVEIKGKQYKVEENCQIRVDRLEEKTGTMIDFDRVLMLSEDKGPKFGQPYVTGAKVTATIGTTIKESKIKVIKFKRRKGYHRTQGHRQKYTMLQVNKISRQE